MFDLISSHAHIQTHSHIISVSYRGGNSGNNTSTDGSFLWLYVPIKQTQSFHFHRSTLKHRSVRLRATWLQRELFGYRQTCCLIDFQHLSARFTFWEGTWGERQRGAGCELVHQKFIHKRSTLLKPGNWKHTHFHVFVSIFFCGCLPLLPLGCLSPSLLLCLSVGIHCFSKAATSCDPPAKNQTALPTARLVHKDTRMPTHWHLHTRVTHTLRRCQQHNVKARLNTTTTHTEDVTTWWVHETLYWTEIGWHHVQHVDLFLNSQICFSCFLPIFQ